MQEEEQEEIVADTDIPITTTRMPANDLTSLIDNRDAPPSKFDEYVRPVFTEFFATLMFVFTGVMASYSGNLVGAALGHGLTIALLVTATGPISGGHINPAVTLGALIAGAIPYLKALLYVIAQLVGGIIGAAIGRGVLSFDSDGFIKMHGGGQVLGDGVGAAQGFLAETMMTILLVGAVLIAAVESDGKNPLAPLAIGFAVAADIFGGGPITGASMNPARSFGPAVATSGMESIQLWKDQWIYWVGPLVGAVIAATIYKLVIASPAKRWFFTGG